MADEDNHPLLQSSEDYSLVQSRSSLPSVRVFYSQIVPTSVLKFHGLWFSSVTPLLQLFSLKSNNRESQLSCLPAEFIQIKKVLWLP